MTSIALMIPTTGIPPDEDLIVDGDAAACVAAGMQAAFSAARFSRALLKPGYGRL